VLRPLAELPDVLGVVAAVPEDATQHLAWRPELARSATTSSRPANRTRQAAVWSLMLASRSTGRASDASVVRPMPKWP